MFFTFSFCCSIFHFHLSQYSQLFVCIFSLDLHFTHCLSSSALQWCLSVLHLHVFRFHLHAFKYFQYFIYLSLSVLHFIWRLSFISVHVFSVPSVCHLIMCRFQYVILTLAQTFHYSSVYYSWFLQFEFLVFVFFIIYVCILNLVLSFHSQYSSLLFQPAFSFLSFIFSFNFFVSLSYFDRIPVFHWSVFVPSVPHFLLVYNLRSVSLIFSLCYVNFSLSLRSVFSFKYSFSFSH
jgi:hypothetical protein